VAASPSISGICTSISTTSNAARARPPRPDVRSPPPRPVPEALKGHQGERPVAGMVFRQEDLQGMEPAHLRIEERSVGGAGLQHPGRVAGAETSMSTSVEAG